MKNCGIVTVDQEINFGEPSVKGVPVANVLDRIREGVLQLEGKKISSCREYKELLGMFPGSLTFGEIAGCLEYAGQAIRNKV